MVLVALQISESINFETGSLVYTSIIIVLPLGTLVAQRLSNPTAFASAASRTGGESKPTGRFGGSTSGKRPLLPGGTQRDNTAVYSGPRASRFGKPKTGVVSTVSSDRFGKPGSDAVDMELARIDGDLESGRVRVNRDFQQSEEML